MSIKKTLCTLVAGLYLMNLIGCSRKEYKGLINGDNISIKEEKFLIDYFNTSTIKKADGTLITYKEDYLNSLNLNPFIHIVRLGKKLNPENLIFNYVKIKKEGKTTKYTPRDTIGWQICEAAKEKFYHYRSIFIRLEKESKEKEENEKLKREFKERNDILESLK